MANRDIAISDRLDADCLYKTKLEAVEIRRSSLTRKTLRTLFMFAVAVGIAFGIVKLALFAGVVRVKEVIVQGNYIIPDEELIELSGVALDMNMEWVDEERVTKALLTHPRVISAVVNKSLTGQVMMNITESIPTALIHLGDTLQVVDNHGNICSLQGEILRWELPLIGPQVYEDFNGDGKIESSGLAGVLQILSAMHNQNLYLGQRICYFNVETMNAYTVDDITVLFADKMGEVELRRASAIYRLAMEKGWAEVDARFKDRIIVDKGEVIEDEGSSGKEG